MHHASISSLQHNNNIGEKYMCVQTFLASLPFIRFRAVTFKFLLALLLTYSVIVARVWVTLA